VVKVKGWTDSNVAKTIHFLYGGTTANYSHIQTPISIGNFNYARKDQNETITGAWTFSNLLNLATTTISNLTIGSLGRLKFESFSPTGVPAIYADSDENSGIHFDGPDIVSIHTGGSDRILANAAGYVGINTTTPAYTLDVTGNSRVTGISTTTSLVITGLTNTVLAVDGSGKVIATSTGSAPIESDPVFTASFASGIASSTNWDTAFSWGNWASGIWASSTLATILNNAVTAYGWGNHASAGYLSNLTGGLNAILGNSTTTNATTTTLAITGLATPAGSFLAVNPNGTVIATTTPMTSVSDGSITLAKLANLAYGTIIGRSSAGTGVPEAISTSTYKGMLALTKTDVGLSNVTNNAQYYPGGTDVAVADGGTGLGSYTTGDLLYASGANTLAKLAGSTAGYFLKANGAGSAPSYAALNQAAVSGLTTGSSPQFTSLTLTGNATIAGNATTTGDMVVGAAGTAKGGCLAMMDTDKAGWTYCTTLNGVMSCSLTDCSGSATSTIKIGR
jgi:hypothetical protein